jgi:two-component sensor histidine kinase
MSESAKSRPTDSQQSVEQMQLLLKEVTHRCANDLQLVAALLELHSRRTASEEASEILNEAADRIVLLARARAMERTRQPTLQAALEQVCAALGSQAEPRSIAIALEFATEADGLSENQITYLAMCVNELATNALKHAFDGCDKGRIAIAVRPCNGGHLAITVEDDGSPLKGEEDGGQAGMGLDLVRGLLRSIGGELREPGVGSKRFEIRVPPATRSSAPKSAVPLRPTGGNGP